VSKGNTKASLAPFDPCHVPATVESVGLLGLLGNAPFLIFQIQLTNYSGTGPRHHGPAESARAKNCMFNVIN